MAWACSCPSWSWAWRFASTSSSTTPAARARGARSARRLAAAWRALVFVGQIVGKWEEGGWVVLISFSMLALAAHAMLLSPLGYREPKQIHRIVRDKARVQGAMASIVEWQSLKMQEYRYCAARRHRALLRAVRRAPTGALRAACRLPASTMMRCTWIIPEARSFLDQYMAIAAQARVRAWAGSPSRPPSRNRLSVVDAPPSIEGGWQAFGPSVADSAMARASVRARPDPSLCPGGPGAH